MMQSAQAFPLHWPAGFQRTKRRQPARFRSTPGRSVSIIQREIELMDGKSIVISTNVPVKRDGTFYQSANISKIEDPGVAVYFVLDGEQRVVACDRWDRLHDNVHACALTIQAMRALDRWGASEILKRAFTGLVALPAPMDWKEVLGFKGYARTEAAVRAAYREAVKRAHPDAGGSAEEMHRVQQALQDGLKAVRS